MSLPVGAVKRGALRAGFLRSASASLGSKQAKRPGLQTAGRCGDGPACTGWLQQCRRPARRPGRSRLTSAPVRLAFSAPMTIQEPDLFSQIKTAETKAVELLRKAEEDRRKLIAEAEKRASSRLQAARAEARRELDATVARARAEAERLESEARAKMTEQSEKAAVVPPEAERQAVKLVVERFFEKWR